MKNGVAFHDLLTVRVPRLAWLEENLISVEVAKELREHFDDLFRGNFPTGGAVEPCGDNGSLEIQLTNG